MEQKQGWGKYFWQVTYAHTIAYAFAGIFAVLFMDYSGLWEQEVVVTLMRPLDHPIIPLGMGLQIFRGLLLALIFLPLRKTFFEERLGLAKLAVMILGLSYLSTFGPGFGSFEGFIYTNLPLRHHFWGIPELALYLASFIGMLYVAKKHGHRKILTALSIVIVALIIFMSLMGFAEAMQVI